MLVVSLSELFLVLLRVSLGAVPSVQGFAELVPPLLAKQVPVVVSLVSLGSHNLTPLDNLDIDKELMGLATSVPLRLARPELAEAAWLPLGLSLAYSQLAVV